MLMGTICEVGMLGGVDGTVDKLFPELLIRFGTMFNKSGYIFKSFSKGSCVTETEMKILPNGGLFVVKGKC